MFLCSRLSQTLFNGFFWATRMQLSSFLSPTGLASCPPVFEHSLVQLECVSCNYLAFGIRQTRFKLFVLNYFALGLARIGLLVFGWVWTKWKGLPRSIWATHPVDSPSTTKHPNRCELDGVDRITGQPRYSTVTEWQIILLVSSVRLSFGSQSEFQWNRALYHFELLSSGRDCDTFAIVAAALNCTSRQKSHVTERDVPRVAGNCALIYCPRSHPIASAIIRWPPAESSQHPTPQKPHGKFADLAALSHTESTDLDYQPEYSLASLTVIDRFTIRSRARLSLQQRPILFVQLRSGHLLHWKKYNSFWVFTKIWNV